MKKTEIAAFLAANIGKPVTIENLANEQSEGEFRFNLNGTLEESETYEGGPAFYVRVKECYQGCSGMQFTLDHVIDAEEHPGSGRVTIVVR